MAVPGVGDPVSMVKAALEGFSHAHQRFQATADASDDPVVAFVPLSETLGWAQSANEAFEKLDGLPYRTARDADSDGRYLGALKFVRNRCTHQLALVAEKKGLSPPWRPPITVGFVFRWRPLAELPPPDPRHPDATGQRLYAELLERDPAGQAIERAAAWFARWEQASPRLRGARS